MQSKLEISNKSDFYELQGVVAKAHSRSNAKDKILAIVILGICQSYGGHMIRSISRVSLCSLLFVKSVIQVCHVRVFTQPYARSTKMSGNNSP